MKKIDMSGEAIIRRSPQTDNPREPSPMKAKKAPEKSATVTADFSDRDVRKPKS